MLVTPASSNTVPHRSARGATAELWATVGLKGKVRVVVGFGIATITVSTGIAQPVHRLPAWVAVARSLIPSHCPISPLHPRYAEAVVVLSDVPNRAADLVNYRPSGGSCSSPRWVTSVQWPAEVVSESWAVAKPADTRGVHLRIAVPACASGNYQDFVGLVRGTFDFFYDAQIPEQTVNSCRVTTIPFSVPERLAPATARRLRYFHEPTGPISQVTTIKSSGSAEGVYTKSTAARAARPAK
ncbi:MAG: hypothetical protein ACHQFZ_05180 [Acidimicrobiales bacterium]